MAKETGFPRVYHKESKGGGDDNLRGALVWNYGLGGGHLCGKEWLLEHECLFKEMWYVIKIMVIFVLPLELEKKENKNAEKQVAYLQICYYNYSDYGCFYYYLYHYKVKQD